MEDMKTTQPTALSWEFIPFDFGQLGRDIAFYASLLRFRERVRGMSELAPRRGSPLGLPHRCIAPSTSVESCP